MRPFQVTNFTIEVFDGHLIFQPPIRFKLVQQLVSQAGVLEIGKTYMNREIRSNWSVITNCDLRITIIAFLSYIAKRVWQVKDPICPGRSSSTKVPVSDGHSRD